MSEANIVEKISNTAALFAGGFLAVAPVLKDGAVTDYRAFWTGLAFMSASIAATGLARGLRGLKQEDYMVAASGGLLAAAGTFGAFHYGTNAWNTKGHGRSAYTLAAPAEPQHTKLTSSFGNQTQELTITTGAKPTFPGNLTLAQVAAAGNRRRALQLSAVA